MSTQAKQTPPVILPPAVDNIEKPDRFTALSFIPNGAPNQVFRFCKWGFEYGTDDKGHAASIILSITLLILLIILFIIGGFFDRSWISDALKILGTAFTFTAGVAIGKGSESAKKPEE
jgi:hypothetical protein